MLFFVVDRLPYNLSGYNGSIILVKDNWDDWFKYETLYYMYYINNSRKIDIGGVKIGQIDMQAGQRSAKIPNEFNEIPDDCFSLGQSDYYYENIKNFGESIREQILTGLNDIAYDLDLYDQVKGLDVTTDSLMRSIYEFTIRQQFHRIAQGRARLTEYDIEYVYPSLGAENRPTLNFRVSPESNPPTNIQVIIGRNNVGKTFLIKNMINAIYHGGQSEEYGKVCSSNSIDNELDNDNAGEQAFANILCVSFSPFDDYKDIQQLSEQGNAIPFSFIGLTEGDLSNSLSLDFLRSLNNCRKSDSKIYLLRKAVDILESDPIFARSNIKALLVLSREDEDERYKDLIITLFKRLSSGHQVVILSLTRMIECIAEKSLIFLDEPENHLHPPLLASFIRALSDLLIDRNGVAIVATHSPVVLQEVPRSCVWKINRSGNEVTTSRLDIESFGATIGALTREVFGLEVRKSGFHKMLEEEVKKGKSYNEILDDFNNELGDEARALLSTLLMLKN